MIALLRHLGPKELDLHRVAGGAGHPIAKGAKRVDIGRVSPVEDAAEPMVDVAHIRRA
jgi:hypothetical protein